MMLNKLPPPVWVDNETTLTRLVKDLHQHAQIAVDTEANSLHAFREQVCLIQFSTPETDYLVDPFAFGHLSELAPIFANPAIEKIFHAAEYDVLGLHRDFGFEFANIFDTMIAARTLSYKTIGLGNMLNEKFGVELNKRFQKADWGARPLKPDLIDYARFDTHYLFALRDLLAEELQTRDRLILAQEDFVRVCYPNGNPDKVQRAAWERVTGSQDLDPQRQAVLNELCLMRERMAEKLNRPPFKVLGDDHLLSVAQNLPHNRKDLVEAGLTERQVNAFGNNLLQAVQRGMTARPPHRHRIERQSDAILVRLDKLKTWRKKIAKQMDVESDVILPRPYLQAIAEKAPETLAALSALMPESPWRVQTFGDDILKTIAKKVK
jgi:ribonuclease D